MREIENIKEPERKFRLETKRQKLDQSRVVNPMKEESEAPRLLKGIYFQPRML